MTNPQTKHQKLLVEYRGKGIAELLAAFEKRKAIEAAKNSNFDIDNSDRITAIVDTLYFVPAETLEQSLRKLAIFTEFEGGHLSEQHSEFLQDINNDVQKFMKEAA